MLKPIIAATALVALAGTSFVYAQQGFGGQGNPGRRRSAVRTPAPAEPPADITAFTDARIAALKKRVSNSPRPG